MTSLEIHIPIGPTPLFLTMLRYLVTSLRRQGGRAARDAAIVVTVGSDETPRDLPAELDWPRRLGIEWRWLPRELYRTRSYYATAAERFRYDFRADLVLMLDADTLIAGDLGPLLASVSQDRSLHGLLAHVSPFEGLGEGANDAMWHRVYSRAGLGPAPLTCEYTGWKRLGRDVRWRSCPPYFNLGVLAAPGEIFRRAGRTIYADMDAVEDVLKTAFKLQIALALALSREELPWAPLPLIYNYPNTMLPADAYALPPRELADVRIFHYLGSGDIDKARDFAGPAAVSRLIRRRDLNAQNRAFVKALRRVHRRIAPVSGVIADEFARASGFGGYTAPAALDAAREMVNVGRHRDALAELSPLIRRRSVNGEVWYLAALASQQSGSLRRAERWYGRALELGYDEFWVRFNRAVLYLKMGKQAEAREDLERTSRLKPDDPNTLALRRHFEAVAPALMTAIE